MSLKNLYAWNGGSQKRFGTGCGLKKSSGCELVVTKSTGCGLKKSTGCEVVTKSTGCSMPPSVK